MNRKYHFLFDTRKCRSKKGYFLKKSILELVRLFDIKKCRSKSMFLLHKMMYDLYNKSFILRRYLLYTFIRDVSVSSFETIQISEKHDGKSFERINDVVLSDADSPDKFLRYASTRNTTR